MDNNDRDTLDNLIDTALSSYARAEPLSGLEERVLRRVQVAQTGRRKMVTLTWALVLTTLALLLVVGVSKEHGRPFEKLLDTAHSTDTRSSPRPSDLPDTAPEKA